MTPEQIIAQSKKDVDTEKEMYKMACSLIKKGLPNEEVLAQMDKANDNMSNPTDGGTLFEIFTSAQSFMSSKAKSDDKPKTIYSMSVPGLIDVVIKDKKIQYLMSDSSVVESIEMNGNMLVPPQRDNLPPELIIANYDDVVRYIHAHNSDLETPEDTDLTDETVKNDFLRTGEDCEECINLFEDLIEYHKKASELPDERFYSLIVAWDFHTYTQEKCNFSPIIYFFSVAERGKSRTMKAMSNVCYRGIMKTDIRDAQLLRECTNVRATLLFDMTDFWKKVVDAGSEDVILNRFEKGITVTRVNRPERGAFQDTDYYQVFGPTVIGTNKMIDDIADTRSINIIMKKSKRDFDNEISVEDAKELKARLVAYRLAHFDRPLKKVGKLSGSRLGDIMRPLHQIIKTVAPHREPDLMESTIIIRNKKIEDKSLSLNGEIIKAFLNCKQYMTAGKVKNQFIVNEVNHERTEREKVGSKTVANLLRSMGFDPATMSDGSRGFFFHEKLLHELAEEHGIDSSGFLSVSDSSVTSVTLEKL